MRERLIAPALAVTAFAVTLGVAAWHGQGHPWISAPQATVLRASTEAPRELPVVKAPPMVAPVQAATVQTAAIQQIDNDGAPAPVLPDAAALPTYEEDQTTRTADSLRNARTR